MSAYSYSPNCQKAPVEPPEHTHRQYSPFEHSTANISKCPPIATHGKPQKAPVEPPKHIFSTNFKNHMKWGGVDLSAPAPQILDFP